jgi:hypothetical protein
VGHGEWESEKPHTLGELQEDTKHEICPIPACEASLEGGTVT